MYVSSLFTRILHDTLKSLHLYCAVKGNGPVKKQQGPETGQDPGNGNAASVNAGGTRQHRSRYTDPAAPIQTASQTGTPKPGATPETDGKGGVVSHLGACYVLQ